MEELKPVRHKQERLAWVGSHTKHPNQDVYLSLLTVSLWQARQQLGQVQCPFLLWQGRRTEAP